MPWGFLAWIGFLFSGERSFEKSRNFDGNFSFDDVFLFAAVLEKFEDFSRHVVPVSRIYES